jgi:hypothetical protein
MLKRLEELEKLILQQTEEQMKFVVRPTQEGESRGFIIFNGKN